MKYALAILLSFFFINCKAQILLKGYKCLFDPNQVVGIMAEMYNNEDTFSSYIYANDVVYVFDENGNQDREKGLKAELNLCFGTNKDYIRTKDDLYIATGRYPNNAFYFKVYIPEKTISISIRSKKNGATFSAKSKWLLSQIRRNREVNLILMNDKHEDCLGYPSPKAADISHHHRTWIYRNYDHTKRNKFMGTWSEHGKHDDTDGIIKCDNIAIDPDTSIFHNYVHSLDLMCKNVYHADTLYLYGILSNLTYLPQEPQGLFAKCYIFHSSLKIIYTQKPFSTDIKKHELRTILYKNSENGIKINNTQPYFLY